MKPGVRNAEILVLLLVSALLQLACASYYPRALYVDIPLVASLYTGWYSSPPKAAFCGSLYGLTQDVVQVAPYWGLNGMSKTVAGFAAAYLHKWIFLEGAVALLMTIALISAIDSLIVNGLLSLVGAPVPPSLWADLCVKAALTAVFGTVVFRVYDHFKFPEKDFRRLRG